MTFGTLDMTRSSKKAARQEAARCAIEYLKSQNLWPDVAGISGIKKKKPSSLQGTQIPAHVIPWTSHDDDACMTFSSSPPCSASASSSLSYAQRVSDLARTLSLGSPEWRYTPSPSPDFHTVACFFSMPGAHAGPIGQVRNILGRKKAKDECARLTLAYLEELERLRIERAMRVMGVVRDGEGEGEGEGVDGKGGKRLEQLGLEESDAHLDVEFQDAMEVLG
jgi:hypothetical protein